jgi:hypothetical protein
MESQAEGKPNGNGRPKDHRKTLSQILADPKVRNGGGFVLRRSYLAGKLHRGSAIWLRVIKPRQTEWAKFLGIERFEDLRPDLRETVRFWIADYLLVSYYVPEGDASTNVKEVRAAMNSMARLTRVLEEHRAPKDKADLPSMFAGMNR